MINRHMFDKVNYLFPLQNTFASETFQNLTAMPPVYELKCLTNKEVSLSCMMIREQSSSEILSQRGWLFR